MLFGKVLFLPLKYVLPPSEDLKTDDALELPER